MNAVNIYIAASRTIMQANAANTESLSEVSKLITVLRQCLSCCVCTAVMTDPMGPVDSICLHNVCRACIGGKMKLRPACSWCKDYQQFVENTQLRIIVQCFKKLCQYLVSSTLVRHLSDATSNGGTNNIMTIIQEGAQVGDDYEHHKNVPELPVYAAIAKLPDNPTRQHFDKRCPGRPRVHKRSRCLSGAATSRSEEESIDPGPEPSSPRFSPKMSPKMSPRACRVAQEHDYINVMRDSRDGVKNSLGSESSGCDELHIKMPRSPDSASVGSPVHSPRSKIHHREHFSSESLNSADTPVGSPTAIQSEPSTSVQNQNPQPKKRGRKPKIKVGCRCGLATPTPGKLTCCGQRCPCYSMFKGCIPDCRCRGCRNPRKVPEDALIGTVQKISRQPSQNAEDDEDSEIEIDI